MRKSKRLEVILGGIIWGVFWAAVSIAILVKL